MAVITEAGALRLYRSNRLEKLVSALATVIGGERDDPIKPELVVVHSAEIGRWLSLRLAEELDICANVIFDFPGKVMQQLFRATLGELPQGEACWSKEHLFWGILHLLPSYLSQPAFSPLSSYLQTARSEGGVDPREISLAERLAATFDRYLTYRPEMILRWDRGELDAEERSDWQPLLWQGLRQHLKGPHLVERAQQFWTLLERSAVSQTTYPLLPARLSLFAVATLPPLYLRLFSALARSLPVHLFLHCPTDGYWADIASRQEQARMMRRAAKQELTAEDLFLTEGNPLLASLGKLGRDFQLVFEGQDLETPYIEPLPGLFEHPGHDSMLHLVQADILQLIHRGGTGAGEAEASPFIAPPLVMRPDDESLRIHACHGKIRQVEVLRDQLLLAFNALEDLQPRDVIVMTPDLEGFAPLIEAVFSDGDSPSRLAAEETNSTPAAGFPALPYRIADLRVQCESPAADALLRILALAGERLTASSVLDLLSLEPIRQRFGLASEEVPKIGRWIHEVGIRWGLDAADRQHHGQPSYRENTWRFGLERLLLGRAMLGDEGQMFCGVLPFEIEEGEEAELLGRLVDFCETLFSELSELRRSRTLLDWRECLLQLMERLLATSEANLWMLQQLRDMLYEITAQAQALAFGRELTLGALRAVLEMSLEGLARQSKFGSGAITVCAMVPLRSIPFRVVCLLGMDEDAFPRPEVRPSFDRIFARPQPGDRDARDDDRYLFLEALLAARDRLIIIYQGRDLQDNKLRPPAVPVGELFDTLLQSCILAEGAASSGVEPLRRQLLLEHPLQAFSPRNFNKEHPASYDRRYLHAAQKLLGPRLMPPPFIAQPLPPPLALGELSLHPSALHQVSSSNVRPLAVAELVRFWDNPCRALLNRRLGLTFGESFERVFDRETLEADALERYLMGERLLRWTCESSAPGALLERLRASGSLPLGAPGDLCYQTVQQTVSSLERHILRYQKGPRQGALAIDLILSQTRLIGSLEGLWPMGRVQYQYSTIQAKHLLQLWLYHLLLCLQRPAGGGQSVLIGRDGEKKTIRCCLLSPLSALEAQTHLQGLLDYYWSGQQLPLLFFPETSRAYWIAQQRDPAGPVDLWLEAARKVWHRPRAPHCRGTSEGEEPHLQRLFASQEPFAPDFRWAGGEVPLALSFHTLALNIWGPLERCLSAESF
jgi:exodeoxyribonuclease V gamma subunit